MTKCYFVTGTDTLIGKTIACTAILQAINLKNITTAGYKPIASGSQISDEGMRNKDALALQNNSSVSLSYESVNPYTFYEPTSPHIVSIYEKKPISLSSLSRGLHLLKEKADWVIIEGAGGWFTPITEKITFADWVVMEKLPVILVVGIKLGCINHALLTALAVRESGLRLAGWIANDIVPQSKRHLEYIKTLKRMLITSFLGEIPWINQPEKCESLGLYLNLRYL